MARKKNKKNKEQNLPEGIHHKPRTKRFHVAQEFKDLHGREAAQELVRKLTPSAADRALGVAEVSTHPGWHPTGGRVL